jgi:hypothetical protein
MKDARDVLDASLVEKTGDSMLASGGIATRQKRARAALTVSSDDSDDSADDGYLQPTPLAVQDAAYGDDVDDHIDDLGVRIGRMCLGERIGGLYRPGIADEVCAPITPSEQPNMGYSDFQFTSPLPSRDFSFATFSSRGYAAKIEVHGPFNRPYLRSDRRNYRDYTTYTSASHRRPIIRTLLVCCSPCGSNHAPTVFRATI